MATSRSPLDGRSTSKPGNQGNAKTNSPRPPRVSKSNGGNMAPTANKSHRMQPANSGGRGVGGSGNGPSKGNSLPR